ncbi:MAG: hypothetical protein PHE51_05485 [Eubacteriales bacterium]|nr:hypothetical protein [Eubacteriales bacterium]
MEEKIINEPVDTNNDAGTEKISFDQLLADKDYQSEFDRRIGKAIETAKSKWEKESISQERYDVLIRELDDFKQREAALGKGIPREMIDYAVFSAKKLINDETDFSTALDTVITSNSWITEGNSSPTTGIPQSMAISGKNGVEKAFERINPKLKL